MSATLFWLMFGGFFGICCAIIAVTSLRLGSEVDHSSLKGKPLTADQIRRLKPLGLSDDEIRDLTK